MIGRLKGKIIFREQKRLILDVNGVGYALYVSLDAFKKISRQTENQEIIFWTHLHVREDALQLYGFLEKAEVEFFEMLIAISGVGPKSAIGILGIASLDLLKRAIASGDTSYLSKVSGIGRKTAEKIVLELRDKLGRAAGAGSEDAVIKGEEDVFDALQALGYSLREARDVLKEIPPEAEGTEARIRAALKLLNK
ncbi:MAG: Holliday junction branch migration protein RuvA [Candidatus Niyogibacteria bacterium]|nr:Holliday junction branch migration protein RuvA [Candidatus Niyogibacteria bacterium]